MRCTFTHQHAPDLAPRKPTPFCVAFSSSIKAAASNQRRNQHQNQNQNESQDSSPVRVRSAERKAASPAADDASSGGDVRERMSAAVTAITSQSANILLHSGKVRPSDYLQCKLPPVPITSWCRLPLLPITYTADYLHCLLPPMQSDTSAECLQRRLPPLSITSTHDHVHCPFPL